MKILYYRKTSRAHGLAELAELAVETATSPKGNLQFQCNLPQNSTKCFRELEIQNKTKIRTNHKIQMKTQRILNSQSNPVQNSTIGGN